jgi:hypothetical protein
MSPVILAEVTIEKDVLDTEDNVAITENPGSGPDPSLFTDKTTFGTVAKAALKVCDPVDVPEREIVPSSITFPVRDPDDILCSYL